MSAMRHMKYILDVAKIISYIFFHWHMSLFKHSAPSHVWIEGHKSTVHPLLNAFNITLNLQQTVHSSITLWYDWESWRGAKVWNMRRMPASLMRFEPPLPATETWSQQAGPQEFALQSDILHILQLSIQTRTSMGEVDPWRRRLKVYS